MSNHVFEWRGIQFKVYSRIYAGSYNVYLEMIGIKERVAVSRQGFYTMPKSKIAIFFNEPGVMLIPVHEVEISNHYYIESRQIHQSNLISPESLIIGGLIYGNLGPQLSNGWYIVSMCEEASGSFVDYSPCENNYLYLGESDYLKELQEKLGIHGFYRNASASYPVTTVAKEQLEMIAWERGED